MDAGVSQHRVGDIYASSATTLQGRSPKFESRTPFHGWATSSEGRPNGGVLPPGDGEWKLGPWMDSCPLLQIFTNKIIEKLEMRGEAWRIARSAPPSKY